MIGVQRLSKTFGANLVVSDLSFGVSDGELLVILGPSGCGKTTTLRLVAGLETPDSGAITIGDQDVTTAPAHQRDVALVFQTPQFLPNRSVAENIAYPLICKDGNWWQLLKGGLSEIQKEAAEECARRLSINHLLNRNPATLSGGELQRVALARALVKQARVFLLDEPLSSVDARLRDGLRQEILNLRTLIATRRHGSIIYVTHDQEDALLLADRIVIMKNGCLIQEGPPQQIYRDPQSLFVATFVGNPPINTFPATLSFDADAIQLCALGQVFPVRLARIRKSLPESSPVSVLAAVRPEALRLDRATTDSVQSEPNDGHVTLNARLLSFSDLGNRSVIRVSVAEQSLSVLSTGESALAVNVGHDVTLRIDSEDLLAFDQDSEERLI